MADAPESRYFEVEQAQLMLEIIRPLMRELLEVRQAILVKEPQVWPVLQKAAGNGGSKEAGRVEREFERLDRLVREIRATGVVLKDVNSGLVDFLARRDGRDVYLCWQYGEPRLMYWHEVEAGYSGRQPL
jgi:hypothetical protein